MNGSINAWEDCIAWDDKPKTKAKGLRLLSDWFDAVYQDAGKNDAVQQDLRKWADEIEALEARVKGLEAEIIDLKTKQKRLLEAIREVQKSFSNLLFDLRF